MEGTLNMRDVEDRVFDIKLRLERLEWFDRERDLESLRKRLEGLEERAAKAER